jgi:hypothetical protein
MTPNDPVGWDTDDPPPVARPGRVYHQPAAESFGADPDDFIATSAETGTAHGAFDDEPPLDTVPPLDGDPQFDPDEYGDGTPPGTEYPPDEYTGNWDDAPDSQNKPRPNRPTRRRRGQPAPIEGLEELVRSSLQQVLAALHRQPTTDCIPTIQGIMAASKVIAQLSDELQQVYVGVFEVLTHECLNNPTGALNLHCCPVVREYSKAVQEELDAIAEVAEAGVGDEANSLWSALKETVQRRFNRSAVERLLSLQDARANVEDLMTAWRQVIDEPPTARRALTNTKPVKTGRDVAAEHKTLTAQRSPMRFSSGYRTLDLAFTGRDEPLGFLAPGEQAVVAGMTGTGKSSFSYGLMAGMTQDLVNWGYPEGKVVWAHTEEESFDKLYAADFCEGQGFHHLAENVVIDAIGTSRRRLVEVMYTLTQEAARLAMETSRDITQFLPHILVLDYIQSLTSEKAKDPTTESIISAELLLRGFQAWNFEEMAKWGEVSYQEYTGETVPQGMENHRMAVVTFAQLNKQDDNLMAYKAGAPKTHPLSDFTLEDTSPNPGWVDQGGSGWAWEVREGDSRILRQNAITGSSVILKNATIILFLHRSRPYNNPEAKDPVTGAKLGRLEDTAARLIPDKTRTGSTLKYVGMEFDIDPKGFRARYYDRRAERAILAGRITSRSLDASWRKPGDPILPVRPKPRPLAGVSY